MAESDLSPEQTIKDLLSPMQKALEELGITPKMLGLKLIEEMNAEETKHFAYQGEVVDERNVIAWDVRQRARQDAHKLRGDYAPEKRDLNIHEDHDYDPEEELILTNAANEIAQKRIAEMRNDNELIEPTEPIEETKKD